MAYEDCIEVGELPSRQSSAALATTRVGVVINSSDQLAAAAAGGNIDGFLYAAVDAANVETTFIPVSEAAEAGGVLVRAGGTCTAGGNAMVTASGKFIDWTAGNTIVGRFETGTTADLDLVRMIAYTRAQQAAGPNAGPPILLSGDGAIAVRPSATSMITKGSAAALTLAAPTAGTDDGVELEITSNTAFAHVITATGLLQTGAAGVNTLTFAAQKGASVRLYAYQGKWNVLNLNAVTPA